MIDKYYLKQDSGKEKSTSTVDELNQTSHDDKGEIDKLPESTVSDKVDSSLDLSISNSVLANEAKTLVLYSNLTYSVQEKDGLYSLDEFRKLFFQVKDDFNALLYYGSQCETFIEKELSILSLCFSLIRNLAEDEVSLIISPRDNEPDKGLGIIDNINEFDKETLNA